VTRHLLEVDDLAPHELEEVLALGQERAAPRVMEGCGAALLFEKPSARTRHSTEMAVVQLGGHPIYVRPDEVGIDQRETAEDVARTLSQFHAAICARVHHHSVLERMAGAGSIPVVNLLSEQAHPLQAIADLLTLASTVGLSGRRIAWVGDFSNVARSLSLAAAMTGLGVSVAAPDGYGPTDADRARVEALGGTLHVTDDPVEAVRGADAVSTDAWYSMGQEEEAEVRRRVFAPYRVDDVLMSTAAAHAVFLHCLPAHRGEEVTDDVLDGPASQVWPQAANRLHAARAALAWLGERGREPCDRRQRVRRPAPADGPHPAPARDQQAARRPPGDQPGAAGRPARRGGRGVDPGHRVARPRRPRRHQGPDRRRRVRLCHPRAAPRAAGPGRPPAPRLR
jgi:ornithine carbamoyltransferase